MQDINEYIKEKILFKKTFTISNRGIYHAHVNLYRSWLQWLIIFIWTLLIYYSWFGYFDLLTVVIFIPIVFFGLFFFTRVFTPLVLLIYPPWRKGRVGEHSIILKENSFTEQTEYNQTMIEWKHIDKVYEREKSISIKFGSEFFYIPKREFSEDEWKLLKIILKEKIGTQKYKVIKMGVLKFIVLFILGLFSMLVLISMTLELQVFNQKLPAEVKKELRTFHKMNNLLKGVTVDDNRDYNISQAMEILDSYLRKDDLKKEFIKDMNNSFSCSVPQELEQIFAWHNGIKNLIPYLDLFSEKKMKYQYEKVKEEQSDKNRPFVPFVVDGENYGLAYHCSGEKGIYAYDPYGYDKPQKIYYGFSHFLTVTADAYKEKAYYQEYGNLHIDEKKLLNIERRYYSKSDRQRYHERIQLYQRKILEHDYNINVVLKTMLIEEIGNTYDENLIDLVKVYLKSEESEVVETALFALGKVGNPSTLPLLYTFLKGSDKSQTNIALLSIASIVNKENNETLQKIYPLLEDTDKLIVLSALEVIYKVADVSSVEKIMALFKYKGYAEQLKMVQILGKIGDIKALPLLNEYLRHINSLDLVLKNNDGFRGSDPHPTFIKDEVEKAIKFVKK